MKIACDECQRVAEEEGLTNWLHLSWEGIDLSAFGNSPLPARFCSVTCLVNYLPRLGS